MPLMVAYMTIRFVLSLVGVLVRRDVSKTLSYSCSVMRTLCCAISRPLDTNRLTGDCQVSHVSAV